MYGNNRRITRYKKNTYQSSRRKAGVKQKYTKFNVNVPVPRAITAGYAGYTLTQHTDFGSYIINTGASTTSDTMLALSFKLNNYGNAAAVTELYDQYRFKKVTVKLFPLVTPAAIGGLISTGAPAAIMIPTIYTAVDFNDDTQIGANKILEYSNAKVQLFDKPLYYRIYPKTNITTPTGVMSGNGWLATSDAAAKWYGLKVCIQNQRDGTNVFPFAYQVLVKAEIEFKNII